MTPKDDKLLPIRDLIARYNVTDRTIDRWLVQGILPEPVRINRRRYWRVDEIEQRERDRIASREFNRADPSAT